MDAARGHRSADAITVKQPRPPFFLDSNSVYSRLPEYNGLRDYNLRSYFSSKHRRRILIKAGLISGKGEVKVRETEATPVWSRDVSYMNMRKSRDEEMFRTPVKPKNVYASSRRSQSVRVSKTSKPKVKKPISHEQLQKIFEKYRLKVRPPEPAKHNSAFFTTELEEEKSPL